MSGLEKGAVVVLLGGPFDGFTGRVEGIEGEVVTVIVSIFGRETPITAAPEALKVVGGASAGSARELQLESIREELRKRFERDCTLVSRRWFLDRPGEVDPRAEWDGFQAAAAERRRAFDEQLAETLRELDEVYGALEDPRARWSTERREWLARSGADLPSDAEYERIRPRFQRAYDAWDAERLGLGGVSSRDLDAPANHHQPTFAGRKVVEYPIDEIERPAEHAYRLWVSAYRPRVTILPIIERLLRDARAAEVEVLLVGSWERCFETSSRHIVEALAAGSGKLSALRAFSLGNMPAENCEISWIQQSDVAPLFSAFPNLEELELYGANGLSLGEAPIVHPRLRSLRIECGGLPVEVLHQLARAQLPSLERLELYLGTERYGWTGSVDDLRPLLSGKLFPKLTWLGLKDSQVQDAVAQAVATSPVLEQLSTLDLSLGTLSDAGADALLASPAVARLDKLDLHHHFMSPETVAKLEGLGIELDASLGQTLDPEDRYVGVSE